MSFYQRANINEHLFIMKKEEPRSPEQLFKQLNWMYHKDTKILDLEWSEDDALFIHTDFRLLTTFMEKLYYAYASLYDDPQIEKLLKKILPADIKEIVVPTMRSHSGNNLKGWMRQYNFSLEEFLTNEKYIVICDQYNAFRHIVDLNLINWDNVAESSMLSDEEDEE